MKDLFLAAIAVMIVFFTFQKSNAKRQHVILTGKPGYGKTSSIYEIAEMLRDEQIPFEGYTTHEVTKGISRVGFEVVNIRTKERATFARLSYICSKSGIRVGQFIIDTEDFDSIVKPIFSTWNNVAKVLIMDEIGKMETCSFYFREVLKEIFRSPNHIVLGTASSSRSVVYNLIKNDTMESDLFFSPIWRENRTSTPFTIAKKVVEMYREMITEPIKQD